ncbi:MAG: class I SAM-dependent methyltransferase [Eubacteriales bacterium]|nr:class I SAM-dependent methyltransferase [Eubacteriales bacterium]
MDGQYEYLAQWYDRLGGHDEKRWGGYLCELLKRGGANPGDKVVDAACGTGEMSIALCRAGYDVMGVDISLPMLTRAADKTAQLGLPIHYVNADMTNLKLHRNVRAVTCACDGVNYVLEEDALLSFFRNARGGLREGGLLLFDVSSAYKLQNMDGQFYGEDDEELAYLWYNRMDSDVLTMELTFFVQEKSGLFRRECETHRQRAWREDELRALLDRAGFACRVYGAFGFEPPRVDEERLQFVAVAK